MWEWKIAIPTPKKLSLNQCLVRCGEGWWGWCGTWTTPLVPAHIYTTAPTRPQHVLAPLRDETGCRSIISKSAKWLGAFRVSAVRQDPAYVSGCRGRCRVPEAGFLNLEHETLRPVNFAEPCYFLPHLGEGRGPDRLVTCVVFLFPPIFNADRKSVV